MVPTSFGQLPTSLEIFGQKKWTRFGPVFPCLWAFLGLFKPFLGLFSLENLWEVYLWLFGELGGKRRCSVKLVALAIQMYVENCPWEPQKPPKSENELCNSKYWRKSRAGFTPPRRTYAAAHSNHSTKEWVKAPLVCVRWHG